MGQRLVALNFAHLQASSACGSFSSLNVARIRSMGGCVSQSHDAAPRDAPSAAPRRAVYTRLSRTHVDGIMDVCGIDGVPDQFASVGEDKQLLLHDWRRGSVLHAWRGHSSTVNRVCALPASRRMLATASRDLTIRLWALGGGDDPVRILRGHDLTVSAITPTADGQRLASGSRDTSVRLWDVETGAALYRSSRAQNLVTCMAWHPTHAHVLLQGGEDLRVRVWDTRVGMREVHALEGYVYFPLGMDVSADGNYLLTSSKGFNGVGCEARVWDLRGDGPLDDTFTHATQVREYRGHQQDTAACAFVRGGGDVHGKRGVFVTASKDGTLRVWERDSGESLSEHTEVGAGAFTAVSMLPPAQQTESRAATAVDDTASQQQGDEAASSTTTQEAPLFVASAYNASLFVYAIQDDWSLSCVARTPPDDDDNDDAAAAVAQPATAMHGRYAV